MITFSKPFRFFDMPIELRNLTYDFMNLHTSPGISQDKIQRASSGCWRLVNSHIATFEYLISPSCDRLCLVFKKRRCMSWRKTKLTLFPTLRNFRMDIKILECKLLKCRPKIRFQVDLGVFLHLLWTIVIKRLVMCQISIKGHQKHGHHQCVPKVNWILSHTLIHDLSN